MNCLTIYYKKDSQRSASAKARCYVTSSMRKDLISEAGIYGYALFEHILNRRISAHKMLEDAVLAKELGLSVRKVSDARRALIKSQWFLERKTRHIIEYFVGKRSVMDAMFGAVNLPMKIKFAIRDVVLAKLCIADAVEDSCNFLDESLYLQAKAEQLLRDGFTEEEVIEVYKAKLQAQQVVNNG